MPLARLLSPASLFCASLLGLAACGGAPDGGQSETDAGADSWSMLISGTWDLPEGSEIYKCVRQTVSEDMYITGFRSLGPLGTHHTVLTAGSPSGPDGISDCSALTNADSMIFGSGIGDVEFNFPEGVGVKIAAGQQLLLNLHLYNYGDTPITGTSGTFASLVSAADIVSEAESVLMGSVNLTIPPGKSDHLGRCTMERSVTLLNVAPHMHAIGSHMKIVAKTSAGDQVLYDQPYDFLDQKLYVLPEPLQLSKDDTIEVTCSYDNDTGSTVKFGDSSTEEMCFTGMYRYPKRSSSPTGITCIF